MLVHIFYRFILPPLVGCILGVGFSMHGQGKNNQNESRSQRTDKPIMQEQGSKESPFACNVSALDASQRERWQGLLEKLAKLKQEVNELPDGYAFRFAAESRTIQELAEFIGYERLCCPFFDFELAIGREGGPVWLRLKGRKGVKAFIRSEFGL